MGNNSDIIEIDGRPIQLARPVDVPEASFIGRENELLLCEMAWGIDYQTHALLSSDLPPLHFRLQGSPGVGKNEIVYELARRTKRPLYMVQGHEELTPEDLSLLLVPTVEKKEGEEYHYDDVPYQTADVVQSSMKLSLQASPLATALLVGGLFFFDEINRVPERALSPLSSVLDGRLSIYSAITGMFIKPLTEEARSSFRFCCALNPEVSGEGRNLPEYIEQRTLPVIEVEPPSFAELVEIISRSLKPRDEVLNGFEVWYREETNMEISIRQALTLVRYAMQHHENQPEEEVTDLIKRIRKYIFK